MGVDGFKSAFARREPLADVVIVFRSGIDGAAATHLLNGLADDFDLRPQAWYNNPQMRIGTATKSALERLFGWRIEREPMPVGTGYWWKSVNLPTHYPKGCELLIESMGLTQPGADDNGQWYEWPNDTITGDGGTPAG